MTSSQQIKYGAILSYISIFINIAIGLLYTPWMIHSIGKENFGLYTLAMSIIGVFVFDFGLSSAVTRFVAKYNAEGAHAEVNELLGIIYKLYIGVDIIILLVLCAIYFLIPTIYQGLSPDEIHKFEIVYAVAASFCVISFPFIPLNGLLSAYEKFIWLKGCDLVHKLVIVGLMSICLLLGYGLYALVVVNAIAGIIAIFLKLLVIVEKTPLSINWKFWNRATLKVVLNFSVWVTIMALAQRCIFNVSPSILGIVSDAQSIAILGIAITIEGYTYTFANAINGLFLPKISRMLTSDTPDKILPLMIKVGRIQILVVGFILIAFIILGKEFIYLWVGSDFSVVYVCALLLIIPSFFHLPQEIAASAVIVMNKVKIQSYVYIVMAVGNILLAFPLARFYGVIGLSISIFIAYIWRTIGMNLIYYKYLHIDLLSFFKASFLKMIFPLLGILCIGVVMNNFFMAISWMEFFLKGGVFFFCYACIMWGLVLNREEKQLVLSPVYKIFGK